MMPLLRSSVRGLTAGVLCALLAGACAGAHPSAVAAPAPTAPAPAGLGLADIRGDGITDDAPALQAALDSAGQASHLIDARAFGALRLGSAVTIPADTRLTLGRTRIIAASPAAFVMMSGAELRGAGAGATVIRYAAGAARPHHAMILSKNSTGVTITALTLDGDRGENRLAGADAIYLAATSRASVTNLEIRGFSGNGLNVIDPLRDNSFAANAISDTGEDGVNNGHAINVLRKRAGITDGLTIENNRIDSTSPASSGAEGIKVLVSDNAGDASIVNVREAGNTIALGRSASGTFAIENWTNSPVTREDGFAIAGNTISGAGGIDGAAGNGDGGISLGGLDGGGRLGSEITGNRLSWLGGLTLEDKWENVRISGNVLEWTASAVTDAQGWTRDFTRGAVWENNRFLHALGGSMRALMIIGTTASISTVAVRRNFLLTPASDGIDVIDNSSSGKTISVAIEDNTFEMGRRIADARMAAHSARLDSPSAMFTSGDVRRWVRVEGAASGGDLLAEISSVDGRATATLSTPAARAVGDVHALIAERSGARAIWLTNPGIVSSIVRGNRIRAMDGRPCDYAGIGVVNGARATLVDNHFEDVNPACREQVR